MTLEETIKIAKEKLWVSTIEGDGSEIDFMINVLDYLKELKCIKERWFDDNK